VPPFHQHAKQIIARPLSSDPCVSAAAATSPSRIEKKFGRAELQCKSRQWRRGQSYDGVRRTSKKRPKGSDGQSWASAPDGHLIAIKTRHY